MKVHDHRKIHKNLYKGNPSQIEVMDVPDLQFIVSKGTSQTKNVYEMHDGDAMWSISRVINRLKDMTKYQMDYKFTLMPLEIIWTKMENEWSWIAMMHVPNLITEDMFQHALEELAKRNRGVRVPVTLEKIEPGTCVQTLHIGSYLEIENAFARIENHCERNGYQIKGKFREIYRNAPFCNVPEKLQTIVRAEITT